MMGKLKQDKGIGLALRSADRIGFQLYDKGDITIFQGYNQS